MNYKLKIIKLKWHHRLFFKIKQIFIKQSVVCETYTLKFDALLYNNKIENISNPVCFGLKGKILYIDNLKFWR